MAQAKDAYPSICNAKAFISPFISSFEQIRSSLPTNLPFSARYVRMKKESAFRGKGTKKGLPHVAADR